MLRAACSRAPVSVLMLHLWCSGPGKQPTPRAARAGGVAAPGRWSSTGAATREAARGPCRQGSAAGGRPAAGLAPAGRDVAALRWTGVHPRPPRPRVRAAARRRRAADRRRARGARTAAPQPVGRGAHAPDAGVGRGVHGREPGGRGAAGGRRDRRRCSAGSRWSSAVRARCCGRCSWSRRPGCWGSPGSAARSATGRRPGSEAPPSGCAGTCAGCDLVAGCRPAPDAARRAGAAERADVLSCAARRAGTSPAARAGRPGGAVPAPTGSGPGR